MTDVPMPVIFLVHVTVYTHGGPRFHSLIRRSLITLLQSAKNVTVKLTGELSHCERAQSGLAGGMPPPTVTHNGSLPAILSVNDRVLTEQKGVNSKETVGNSPGPF